ncbi:hypothetical protein [Stutzerimonas stutzeri]
MLWKLNWEIGQLVRELRRSEETPFASQGAAFHAFNCAVTAWHVVDWAWVEGKDKLGGNKKKWIKNITDECPQLAICQALSNNGKHAIGSYGGDLEAREIVTFKSVRGENGDLVQFVGSFRITLSYKGDDYEAVDLFRSAGKYLQTHMVKAGVLDGLWRHGYVFDGESLEAD